MPADTFTETVETEVLGETQDGFLETAEKEVLVDQESLDELPEDMKITITGAKEDEVSLTVLPRPADLGGSGVEMHEHVQGWGISF